MVWAVWFLFNIENYEPISLNLITKEMKFSVLTIQLLEILKVAFRFTSCSPNLAHDLKKFLMLYIICTGLVYGT